MEKNKNKKLTPDEEKLIDDIYRISKTEAIHFLELLASQDVTLPEAVTALGQFNAISIEGLALIAEEEDREELKQNIVYRLKAGLDFFISKIPLPKNV